jgi:hypothetical protein
MGATLSGVDIVGVREDVFIVGVIVLQCHFHLRAILASGEIYWRAVQNFFIFV